MSYFILMGFAQSNLDSQRLSEIKTVAILALSNSKKHNTQMAVTAVYCLRQLTAIIEVTTVYKNRGQPLYGRRAEVSIKYV